MKNDNASIENRIKFECSNGGIITIIGDNGSTDIKRFGVDKKFAYFDDLYIDSYNNITIDVDGEYNVQGTVKHITGKSVMRFNLISNVPRAKADFKMTNLQPDAWYRLQFNNILAKTDSGRAYGKTNDFGSLEFKGVIIPNG